MGSPTRTAVRALALAAVAALSLTACGGSSGGGAGGGDDVNQGQDLKPGAIGALDQPFSRPKVPDIGEVRVALDEGFQDYNNNTGAANSVSNNYLLGLVIPSPYFEDADFSLKVDKDYMESVTVKSTTPQVIEFKWRPDAVWSDGAPVGCKDMWLAYLANANAVIKTGVNRSTPRQRLRPDLQARVLTGRQDRHGHLRYAVRRLAGMWSMVAQGGNQLLPAHVLEQRTGIPDITKVGLADSPELRKAAAFYTKGWNDFSADVDLSAGPYLIKSSTRNQQAVLVRNPKWWGNPGGPSQIDTQAVTDSQAAVQALLNKETPVIGPQPTRPSPSRCVPAVTSRCSPGAGRPTSTRLQHGPADLPRPPGAAQRGRRLHHRQDIVDKLVKGIDPKIKPLGAFTINPTRRLHRPLPGRRHRGHGQAKKLLEDAGWKLGADGVYAKGGQRASFTIGTSWSTGAPRPCS